MRWKDFGLGLGLPGMEEASRVSEHPVSVGARVEPEAPKHKDKHKYKMHPGLPPEEKQGYYMSDYAVHI